MKFFKKLMKVLLKTIIIFTILSAFAIILTLIFKYNLSDTLMYLGLGCLVIGITSIPGSISMKGNASFFQAESVSVRSITKSTADDFKERTRNYALLLYMFLDSMLLFFLSYLVGIYLI